MDATEPAAGGPPVTDDLHERPVELLRHLVRFDTTNPPGNERPCIEWVGDVLESYGVDYESYAADPERPNLVGRVEGSHGSEENGATGSNENEDVGESTAPLMLYGHVDVVPTTDQDWTHPPFEGVVEDGFVWGRGTLDMKGGVAMLLAAYLRAVAEDAVPPGGLLLCLVSDEEAGGDDGARYLVENHPAVFEDVDYALGEFGGFSMDVAGQRFYPVQVAEKQVCWLELTFTGQGGHGSFPNDDDAMARMAAAVTALDGSRLPVHVTPPAREMIGTMAAELSPPESWVLAGLLRPALTDHLLGFLGDDAETFDTILHNTVNTTVVRGGDKENVVPEQVELTLDVRILPGFDADDAIAELRSVVGDGPDIDVIRFEEGPPEADMGLFDHLAGVLERADPEGVVIPYLLPAGSDARIFANAGVQTYGFTPMQLPEDFEFTEYVHAADERIPVESVEWGTDRVFEAVTGFDGRA